MAERIDLTEAPLPAARRPVQKGKGKGTGSPKLDEFARRVLGPAALVTILLTLYLLWGLLSGAWSHQVMGQLPLARRTLQLDNISLVFHLLQISSLVMLASLLTACAQVEGIGYWLLGAAAVFYAGPSFLVNQIYPMKKITASNASNTVLADFQILAWLFAVPGAVWTIVELVRRVAAAADLAAIQRANAKYGSGTKTQPKSKQRQVFLGRCWEGPYCRDHIRAKCPIHIKRRGPCWWYKEGCMCEERIVLQAMIAPDWKDQMARAHQNQTLGGPRKHLSPEAKAERCRNCIIYNEHQRQKHKALTGVALVVVPGLLIWQFPVLQTVVGAILKGLDDLTRRFTPGVADPSGIPALHNSAYALIAWVFVFALGVVLLSQVMKVIEYACFKLKI
jgi:hypothetical protein